PSPAGADATIAVGRHGVRAATVTAPDGGITLIFPAGAFAPAGAEGIRVLVDAADPTTVTPPAEKGHRPAATPRPGRAPLRGGGGRGGDAPAQRRGRGARAARLVTGLDEQRVGVDRPVDDGVPVRARRPGRGDHVRVVLEVIVRRSACRIAGRSHVADDVARL